MACLEGVQRVLQGFIGGFTQFWHVCNRPDLSLSLANLGVPTGGKEGKTSE